MKEQDTNCEDCSKYVVCKFKEGYKTDVNTLVAKSDITEVTVRCREFVKAELRFREEWIVEPSWQEALGLEDTDEY